MTQKELNILRVLFLSNTELDNAIKKDLSVRANAENIERLINKQRSLLMSLSK